MGQFVSEYVKPAQQNSDFAAEREAIWMHA